ncbi:CRISPR-associated endonuclease/helicase Cas3 [Mycobacterium frederiksbergense]|uniref:CRISPR-associated endonuclease/helicase Cas3 n=1 Tax=Mycolicibacterium frederiksbergense TaxID=117567 RepID=A0ABT6L331_9MYCO|nr:type I-U CRISPR-associated helicase/endonuclease Cas3 [Mycolicibacterium frederiksbergense]MDH6196720.1 CRISPR-associated endonuclease/helicase Cas3 [Mycolicibacterium frederiksbergense]
MNGLSVDEFDAYFAELHGYPPFAWQSRLCRLIVETGQWPESIGAPTGTGKSNVVDVHAFVNALYGWDNGPRVPRRLAVVVNRRAIVDAHEQRAIDLQNNLRSPRTDVVARVAEGLRRLCHESSPPSELLTLATLRGGLLPDRSWIDDPTSCSIVCATPDMWGSRLLFGGYGSSPQAHPREAGLLAFDSVMVLDEAHLNVQLLRTARRVRELIQRFPAPAPVLQVVETTATPVGDNDERSLGVTEEDVATDAVLARRLTRPKPVTYHATDLWPDKRRSSDKYVNEILDVVIDMWNNIDGTVGCVVNTVSTAVRLAHALRDRLSVEPSRNHVLTWVGPMRPMDLEAQVEAHPLAFRPDGDERVGVIVATQTIEVGVDIDFAALVTELAPGAALAQRAGRVNRLGSRLAGPIVVIGPVGDPKGSSPYEADELTTAQEWALRRAATADGLAPVALFTDPAPAASDRRDVFARLEAGDVEALATTSEKLAAPPERSLWLRDDLEPDRQECGIVLRAKLPENDLDALALLQATPPAARETFPVRIQLAREICRALGKLESPHGRAFVWRDNSIAQMQLGSGEEPKPGDVLILDSGHPIVREHTIVEYGDGNEVQDTVWGATDADGDADGREVEVLWRSDHLHLFTQIDGIVADQEHDANDIQELVNDFVSSERQVTVGRPYEGNEDGEVPWLVLRPARVVTDDDETRQTWGGTKPVKLDRHSTAVAQRARSLSLHLSLTDSEVDALELAGLHHDAGKRDPRFQLMLGARPGQEPRAKSGGASSRRAQLEKARAGLPSGWRHEQLSVVLAHDSLSEHDRDQRDLILRLVGTSHGHGRCAFPHSADQLIDPQNPALRPLADEFFDRGGWEALVEATHRRAGPWACAYYEALLRAADCTVSKEGS